MLIFGNRATDNRFIIESTNHVDGIFWDNFNVQYYNKPSKLSKGFSILESKLYFPDCLTHS